jgi:hypothetical protein
VALCLSAPATPVGPHAAELTGTDLALPGSGYVYLEHAGSLGLQVSEATETA